MVVGSRELDWFVGLELSGFLEYMALCVSKIVTSTRFYINETLLHSQMNLLGRFSLIFCELWTALFDRWGLDKLSYDFPSTSIYRGIKQDLN